MVETITPSITGEGVKVWFTTSDADARFFKEYRAQCEHHHTNCTHYGCEHVRELLYRHFNYTPMKLKPTRENAFEMERLRKSYSLLRGKGKLLDVGCGDGPFHQFIKNYTITGLDPNPTAIARANKQHKKHTYLQAGIEYLPNIPSSSYDAICCFEVLEHLPTKVVDEVMQQFHRILKPDGELIISVPQQYYPELLFGYLIGPKSPLGYSKTHFRNYSRHKLTSLVKKHGFVNPIVRGYHVFIPFLAKILGEAPAINFKSNLSWKWPSASQTIIVRSTKLSRR